MKGPPSSVLRGPVRRARDVRELVTVLALATVTEVSLRTTTLPATARLLRVRLDPNVESTGRDPDRSEPPVLPVTARRQVRAVQTIVGRWPFGDTCLRRSLVLGQRLHRLDPALVVGVRKDDAGAFAAHAWLVVDGRSLDPESRQFEVLAGRW